MQMDKFIFCFIVFFASFSALGSDVNVGYSFFKAEDPNRLSWDETKKRPIISHIFYPTRSENVETIKLGAPESKYFIAGQAVPDAQYLDGDRRPLIMMSHGTGGLALQMLWLAESFVKRGYIVLAFNHHGNTAFERAKHPAGFFLWWERSRDMAVALKQLSEDSVWEQRVNFDQVGVLGFSLGGYTVISSAGGVTDKSLFYKFCDSPERDFTCEPQKEFTEISQEFEKIKGRDVVRRSLKRQSISYKIDRVKGVFAIAPAVAQSFTLDSLKSIDVPISIVVGTKDYVAPGGTNGKYIASIIPRAEYRELDGVGHYTFLSECTEKGKKYLSDLCNDSASVDRHIIHKKISAQAVSFFDRLFFRENFSEAKITNRSN